MQRWYEQQQETVRSVPQTLPPKPIERRYDTQTMHKAVEIAAKMQAEHQETLTAKEIEAIAAEAGIEPRFIHRALSIAENEVVGQQPVATQTKQRSRRRLSRRVRSLIFGVPFIYFFFLLPFAFIMMKSRGDMNEILPTLLILVIPTLITILTASQMRRPRQGAVAGFFMGLSVFLGLLCASIATGIGPDHSDGILAALFLLTAGGTVLGATTTWVRRHLPLWLAGNDRLTADE